MLDGTNVEEVVNFERIQDKFDMENVQYFDPTNTAALQIFPTYISFK